ncbi:unnamed protein product [Cylicocyclus nassatus]|uniref:Uncharacterized protein n=1 Tax=Cylicocyclus nassatus TaxID=53992 RepID=A0AA36GJH5_CYLNA|nr:unnamed protein product [Cylicocyclus nassatus]
MGGNIMAARKKNITINGKKYPVKEFDYNLVCDLEDMGFDMKDVEKKTYVYGHTHDRGSVNSKELGENVQERKYNSFREMIENELLPYALSIGITEEKFYTLNPRKIKPYEKAYHLRRRMEDENNFWLGQYIRYAVGSVLSEKGEYPKEPLLKEYYEDLDLTEEERDNKELRKMLMYEEQWRMNDKQLGLPEVNIK